MSERSHRAVGVAGRRGLARARRVGVLDRGVAVARQVAERVERERRRARAFAHLREPAERVIGEAARVAVRVGVVAQHVVDTQQVARRIPGRVAQPRQIRVGPGAGAAAGQARQRRADAPEMSRVDRRVVGCGVAGKFRDSVAVVGAHEPSLPVPPGGRDDRAGVRSHGGRPVQVIEVDAHDGLAVGVPVVVARRDPAVEVVVGVRHVRVDRARALHGDPAAPGHEPRTVVVGIVLAGAGTSCPRRRPPDLADAAAARVVRVLRARLRPAPLAQPPAFVVRELDSRPVGL